MPFDGGDFSRSSGLRFPNMPPTGRRSPLAAWFRGLLLPGGPGNHVARSLPPPGRLDPIPELAAIHLLRAARALIEAEETWGQGRYHAPDGRRCAVGALRAATQASWHGIRGKMEAHTLLLAVAKERGFDSVELMNDRSTHVQVLAAFDAAIASAKDRSAPACPGAF